MSILHLDVESKSVVDLPKANAYVYFDDPSTDLWLAAWSFDDEEPVLWFPGEPCPDRIRKHVESGGLIYAWNAAFERLAWRKLLGPKYGWPVPDLRQFRCVMAAAYALGMPGKLEQAAPALGLDIVKDAAGHRLMLQMSKPRRATKGADPNVIQWWDDQDKIERLGLYCLQDVRTEVGCHNRLLPLRPQEQELWFLDQEMNDRGCYIDAMLCAASQLVVDQAMGRLNDEMKMATAFEVRGVTNVGELTAFVRERGVETESLAKEDLAAVLMRDDIPADVRRALEIRQEGGKTSTAKIGAMLKRRQADGRMRGLLQYHGAGPGRWAARGAQLQNLPRQSMKISPTVISDIMHGDASVIEMLYGPAMTVISDAIRAMIQAPKGKKIVAADFSQIEARITAWLSGQQDVLDAFAKADNKQGPDIYIAEATKIYQVAPGVIDADDPRRQVGKVAILSLGFQGGALALLKMAKNYRMNIGDAFDAVWSASSDQNKQKAGEAWVERGKKSGVNETPWMAAELIKLAWRQANPHTVAMWKTVEEAAIEATENPGTVVEAGRLKYRKAGSWLFCRLPCGRTIAYAYPKVEMKAMPWNDRNGDPVMKPSLSFWGVDSFTKKWAKQHFYGGLGFQNAVQGTARDVMAEGMTRADALGYPPILTVHDENVAETDKGFGSVKEFCSIMSEIPAWLEGCPVTATGWEGDRYRK